MENMNSHAFARKPGPRLEDLINFDPRLDPIALGKSQLGDTTASVQSSG
jgi:hypothetical protein